MLQSQNNLFFIIFQSINTPRTCKAHVGDGQQETTRVGTDIDVARYKKTVSSANWVQMALALYSLQ